MPTRADLVAATLAILLHAGLGYELWRAPPPAVRAASRVEVEFRAPPPRAPAPPVVAAPAEPPPPRPRPTAVRRPVTGPLAARPRPVERRVASVEASPPPVRSPEPGPPSPPVFGYSMDSTVGDSSTSVPVGEPGAARVNAPVPRRTPEAGAAGPASPGAAVLAVTTLPEIDTEACGRTVTYPKEAAALGIEGAVRLRVELDERGRVVDVKVLSGLGHGLDGEAVEALRHRCTFSPAIASDGRPVPFVIDPYVFHFEIPR